MDETMPEINENNWNEYNSKGEDRPGEKVIIRLGTVRQFIPKKNAAFEVLTWVKKTKIMGYAVIGTSLIVAIGSAFNVWGGAIPAGIVSVLGALSIKKSMAQESYLHNEYGIDTRAK